MRDRGEDRKGQASQAGGQAQRPTGPAERALELGLLNEIVPEDQLMDKAFEWAGRITANAPLAVQATKESVMQGLALDLEEAFKFESKIASKVFQTEDAKEGPKAFAEKREPKWQAR